jgi:hypothetical protein
MTRRGYTYRRRTGAIVRVGPTRIRNFGLPGRGPLIIPVKRSGMLTRYGYTAKQRLAGRRRTALRRAMSAGQTPLQVFHRLNAIQKLSSRTRPVYAKRYSANRSWVSRKYI